MVLWWGGFGVLKVPATVTIGILAMFIQYSQRFWRPIQDLSDKFNILQSAMAACERIFPRDASPGALDLGVPQYVDGAFDAHPLPPWTEGLRAGLARLDLQATRDFAAPFFHLGPKDQDALLTSWETDVDADNASFVRNLIVATLEGAFAAPAYGGNRDSAGWSSLGFPIDPFPPAKGAP